ncbi:MAG: DUF87 domain-containing protein [Anaerolineae bacterium]|nr:DUF87 domain-containing protein [Anaerolineae bacterium]
MADMERKAAFYLGKEYDLASGDLAGDEPLMYDARDLTTHAVCIGMTGSGKTGLGTILLEEAALDGIPAIVIDPKGDMTNLLLTFPDLLASDFEPWVNLDDARRKNLSVPEYARSTADLWRNGLSEWGQDGERIRRMRERAEFAIYTPGSNAGLQVSMLQSLQAPALSWDDDEEILREMIAGTVSGLLGLAGIQADPVQSREHILMAHIFEHAWRRGQDLDMATLIEAIQRPPVQKLGVFDVETVYPERDRFALAMALNRVVASPSFQNWLEGAPLDMNALTHTAEGKPRVSVFYIAHLEDAERIFFVTMLLQQVLGWMRQLSGTTSLRCMVYFDEVFGYFPPYPANPASKQPLLSLLKTARAFGIGLVLTTQNPVDLDYKGLTNAGTWFIGKLQTDRDKARLLEGLEGVISEAGTMLDRSYLDRLISSLDSRVFILHNVHADQPILFKTRWALSYLRGPLTRRQIRALMDPVKAEHGGAASEALFEVPPAREPRMEQAERPRATTRSVQQAKPEIPEGYSRLQPRVHGRISQYYLAIDTSDRQAEREFVRSQGAGGEVEQSYLAYVPHLLGRASVLYTDSKRTRSKEESLTYLVPLSDASGFIEWERHLMHGLERQHLESQPQADALYGIVPASLTSTPAYTQYRDGLIDYIYREHSLPLWAHAELGLRSEVGETEREFAARVQEEARRQRDAELEKAGDKYARDLDRLQGRLDKEERELEDDRIDFEGRKREELLSAGESILSMVLGRRRSSALSQASRRRRMTQQARADIEESEEVVEDLQEDIAELLKERDAALEEVRAKWADVATQIVQEPMRPKKTDIRVEAFGLCWVPHWLFVYRDGRGNAREELVLACTAAGEA